METEYNNKIIERLRLMPKFHLFEMVKTPDGEGILVKLETEFNGLYISEERSKAIVWYSTEEAQNGYVSKEYSLKELSSLSKENGDEETEKCESCEKVIEGNNFVMDDDACYTCLKCQCAFLEEELTAANEMISAQRLEPNQDVPFKAAYMRDLEKQLTAEQISYSRMIELLNEKSYHFYKSLQNKPELTEDDIKWLIFYGYNKDKTIVIDEEVGQLDYAITQMFIMAKESTWFDIDRVEKLMWKRIAALFNYSLPHHIKIT